MKCNRYFLFLFIIFFFASCGRKALVTSTNIGGLATDVKGTVLLKVSIAWEDSSSDYTVLKKFETSGSSLSPKSEKQLIIIPEEQLFYSVLKFEVEKPVLDEGCAVIKFRPYYYTKNNKDTEFRPDPNSDSTVDCSDGKNAACFGGAAKDLIAGFPLFDAKFSTSGMIEVSFSQPTHYAGDGNRFAANDLFENGTPGDPSVRYVTGSVKDYSAYCEDIFGNVLARINLTISDDNGTNPNTDHFCSWASTSSSGCLNE